MHVLYLIVTGKPFDSVVRKSSSEWHIKKGPDDVVRCFIQYQLALVPLFYLSFASSSKVL